MTQEEIKEYLKKNLKLEWDYKKHNYYLTLTLGGEKITEVSFGEGY